MKNFAHKIHTFWDTKILEPVLEFSKHMLFKIKIKIWGCQLLINLFRDPSCQIAVNT